MKMIRFDKNLLDKYVKYSSISVEKHPTEELYLYGYHSGLEKSNVIWDDNNIHCRGLIINGEGEVLARPFPKFFTYRRYIDDETLLLSEGQNFKIPETGFKIFEKVDGTMTTLYWVDDKPFLATQRSFENVNAKEATKILYEKYSHTFSKLKRDRTYVFEAIFPETNVLIDYGTSRDLYMIGVLDNETGDNLPLEDLGFPVAKDYTEMYKDVKNFEALQNLNLPNQEGFVLVFESGERIKLKFPWYKEAHKIMAEIIQKEKQLYLMNRQLSQKLGLKNSYITNLLIWDHLRKGLTVENIHENTPETFFAVGVEQWIINTKADLQNEFNNAKNSNPNLSQDELWQMVKPEKLTFFNYDKKLSETEYSTNMWKRINRLKKVYR